MNAPLRPAAVYVIELCSGERCRWRYLGPEPGEAEPRWHDLESGREFRESSLMYAWKVIAEEAPAPR
jgi:hypothetical protein